MSKGNEINLAGLLSVESCCLLYDFLWFPGGCRLINNFFLLFTMVPGTTDEEIDSFCFPDSSSHFPFFKRHIFHFCSPLGPLLILASSKCWLVPLHLGTKSMNIQVSQFCCWEYVQHFKTGTCWVGNRTYPGKITKNAQLHVFNVKGVVETLSKKRDGRWDNDTAPGD